MLQAFVWVGEGAEIGVRGRSRGDEIGDNWAGCLPTRAAHELIGGLLHLERHRAGGLHRGSPRLLHERENTEDPPDPPSPPA